MKYGIVVERMRRDFTERVRVVVPTFLRERSIFRDISWKKMTE